MSSAAHALDRTPSAGDRVTAHVTATDGKSRQATIASITLPNGSIVLTKEDLAIFGDGDATRGAHEIRLMIANERDRAINEKPCPRSASASVRLGRPSDEDGIFELLLLDIAENAASVAPASEEDIRATVKQALSKPNIVGVIDGPNGKPVAVVMLLCLKWWWSKAHYYQEVPLFVHPEHRKSTHARQLISFQRWWADTMTENFGYRVYLLCGVLGTKRVRSKIAMYRRMFRQVGAAYLYPWSGGTEE